MAAEVPQGPRGDVAKYKAPQLLAAPADPPQGAVLQRNG